MALQPLIDMRRMDASLQYSTVSDLLRDFRKFLERDADVPVERIELNGALLLNDLCRFLKLGEQQRMKVLGRSAAAYVDALLDEGVTLPAIRRAG
jgi:hypothetical protein